MYTDQIKGLGTKYLDKMIELRRQIHMYPELQFEEVKTAKLVADTLKELGIEYTEGVAKTGVVGLIKGGKPGKTVLLRADMDALAVEEEADVVYKSRVPGVMHACGHDGHTASLLGTAMILNELKDQLSGNIKLMFQPAEEGKGGAEPMIQEGILENPKVDAAFGLHVASDLNEGKVRVRKGPAMAAPDEFFFKVIGKGGHAAAPHNTIDPLVITSQVIIGLQTIISRRRNPVEPAVITCSKIRGGEAHNIIPDSVEVTGTIRTLDPDVRNWIGEEMERIIKGITSTYGASYELDITRRYPPLINNEEATEHAKTSIAKIIGEENIIEADKPQMGAEDFAYLCEKVPASFFFVGIKAKDKETIPGHNCKFAWDDKNLLISSTCLAQVALDYLNK